MAKCGRSTVNSAFSAKDMAVAAEDMGARELGWVFDTGLAGVAKVDMFTHFNRDHSFFLLQCVDCNNSRLVLGHGRSVPINGPNMSSILGLKDGGSVELEHVDGPPLAEEVYDARLMLGLSLSNIEIDTVALGSIVKEEHPAEMSEFYVNRFKLAYAMLAVSVFFRPGDKRWHVPRDAYLLAAMIPDLGNINWGNYVARGIVDGSFQVQRDVARGSRGHSVYGCLYALEVYLTFAVSK
jgi:ribosomal protein S27E